MSHEKIMSKMCSMVRKSDQKHKKVVERYLSLANKELHDLFSKSTKEFSGFGDWGIIGGSMSIERGFKEKFGFFTPRSNPVTVEDS